MKRLLLIPIDILRNGFNFFRMSVELFDYFGALSVSTTLVKLTSNSSLVSMTPVKLSFTGVNDTGETPQNLLLHYSRPQKKAPVGKSETLLFLIIRGILNEFFADFFA